TQGSMPIDNYLLSGIAGIYPPIAGALAVFGIYLLFAANYRREFALIGAALASFLIIFILKLSAGEMEVQPFGFFSVTLSLALYAWLLKERSSPLKLPLLISLLILYFGLMLGSSSVVVFNSAILIFFPVYSAILFIKRDSASLLELVKIHLPFVIVSLYLSAIVLSFFVHGFGNGNANNLFVPSSIALVILAETIACFILYQILTRYIKDSETTVYVLFGSALAGAALFLFTPFGNIVKGIGVGALRAATFDTALKRTIAEQGTAGGAFQSQRRVQR
ncbi:hypothetical protein HZC08_00670, partial [Candidatus Micrarchaeota archaeon]|nr:hypothetical protein [Candidatus Micrarchaeota archaeon]